jgi:uncharacterized protein YecT (DUF1311 family)
MRSFCVLSLAVIAAVSAVPARQPIGANVPSGSKPWTQLSVTAGDTDSLPAHCDAAGTTVAIEKCLQTKLATTNRQLLVVERSVHDRLQAGAQAAFDSAAAQWRRYRDDECRATYAEYRDGTIAPVVMLACEIDLATQRRRGLRPLYSLTAGRP